MNTIKTILAATIIVMLISAPTSALELTGRVIAVSDGDLLTLLTADERQIKIRLAENDAPEDGQPFGNKAQQQLSKLVHGHVVTVSVQTTDRYGRKVGCLVIGDLNGCAIKGNINSQGDKIYHLPDSGSYVATRIDEANGERWFCSEENAARAGWRPRR